MPDSTIDSSVVAGGTIDGTNFVEITVDGDVVWVAISTLMEIFSGTAYNGQKVEFSLSGNSGASSLTFTGVETTASNSATGSLNNGGSDTLNVNGDADPSNANLTISASNSETSYSEYGSNGGNMYISNSNDILSINNTYVETDNFVSGQTTQWDLVDLDFDAGNSTDYISLVSGTNPEDRTTTISYDSDIENIEVYSFGDSSLDISLDGSYVGYIPNTTDGWESISSFDGYSASGSVTINIAAEYCSDFMCPTGYIGDPGNNSNDPAFRFSSPSTSSITFSSPSDSTTINSAYSSSYLSYNKGDTISVSIDGADTSYGASYDATLGMTDPSIDVGSSTVSYNGNLDGSYTESVNLSLSTDNISASFSGDGSLSYDLNWDEKIHTTDPSLTINGTTFTHNGVLSPGSTTSFTPSESLFGETTDVLDLALTAGEVDVNFDLEIQDQNSVTIDTLPNNWNTNFSSL